MKYLIFIRNIIISCAMLGVHTFAHSETASLPKNIADQLPKGYSVMTIQSGDLNNDKLIDYIVVLHKEDEGKIFQRTEKAPRRPLLIFIQKSDHTFAMSARNEYVVYTIDAGGQCDPFLDSGDGITINGVFFTVENGVACGDHWSDYITFKYSDTLKNWIFHKRIYENWVMNSGRKPNDDALVLGARKVTLGKQGKPVLFPDYRPD